MAACGVDGVDVLRPASRAKFLSETPPMHHIFLGIFSPSSTTDGVAFARIKLGTKPPKTEQTKQLLGPLISDLESLLAGPRMIKAQFDDSGCLTAA
jgi:hypothetical protein